MKNLKAVITTAVILLAAVGCVWVYKLGVEYGAQKTAQVRVNLETESIEKENDALEAQRKEYQKDIDSTQTDIEKNESENKTLDEYYKKIEDCENKISNLKSELESAKKEEAAVKGYNVDLSGISNEATGSPKEYKDKTFLCPADISAGRYKISGSGSFRIITNVNNTVTESQNLNNTDNNSYTVNIENDSKIIVEGTLTFTPVN